MTMPNDTPASKRFSDLRKRAEKALHQLGGTVELDNTKGTKFLIRFKERTHKGVI
jgi:two-component sensor histidine kinase